MEPKLIKKGPFAIIGFEIRTTGKNGLASKEIPEFWERINKEKMLDKIPNKKDLHSCLGVCVEDHREDGTFAYLAACEVTSTKNVPEGMVKYDFPASEYAVFTVQGDVPKSIQDAWEDVYGKWLPKSGYKKSGSFDFEYYDERFGNKIPEMDILIPIEK